MGLSPSPMTYKCHLRVLCPVRRPITTLDCVLLKDSNRALVAKSGPEINSWAYLCVLQGPRHITKCWLSIQHLIFLLMFCVETPKKGSGPTNFWTELFLCELFGDFISSHLGMTRDPVQPHSVPGRDVIQCLLALSYQGRLVLAGWSAFRATWLSEQILTYFSGLSWVSVLRTQANIAHTSAWKTVACFPERCWTFYLQIAHRPPAPVPSTVWIHP